MLKYCRSCNSKKLVDIFSLGSQYLSEFRDDDVKPAQYPLDLILCENCKLLQLKDTVPPFELYTDNYGYRSSISGTIRSNLEEIAKEAIAIVDDKDLPKPFVVDIGCNDGYLLKQYPTDYFRVGFDPVEKFIEQSSIHANQIFVDYFSAEKLEGYPKATVVTSISCFYDLSDPNKFVSDVAKILDPKGIFVIQQNYLVGMILQNAIDNICHEHLEYYSLMSLEPLLERHGLEVFDVKLNDVNGGSFRTLICHKGSRKIEASVESLRKSESYLFLEEVDTYRHFAKRIALEMEELEKFVTKEVKAGKKIYLIGASTRGGTLLQAAHLDNKLISGISERNPEKWGKKLASVGIPIVSEKEAREAKPDYFLILMWYFADEIITRELEYLQEGGKLIIPLPKLNVIDINGKVEYSNE